MRTRALTTTEVRTLRFRLAADGLKQVPFPLEGVITIDRSRTGVLDAFRCRYTDALSHSTHQEALENIAAGNGTSGTIVGHGRAGEIYTGSGDERLNDASSFLGLENIGVWQGSITRLGAHGLRSVLLCACDTGSGFDGVRFVSAFAAALRVVVHAPTEFVYAPEHCAGDPSMESFGRLRGSTDLPADMLAPSSDILPLESDATRRTLVLQTESGLLEVPIDAIDAIRFSGQPGGLLSGLAFEGEQARQAAFFIRGPLPFGLTNPAASLDGTMWLSFDGMEREFLLYNGRRLEDARSGICYKLDGAGLRAWSERSQPRP